MTLDSAINRFRERQASLFRDSAVVRRPSGTSTLNESTGNETPAPATQIYDGECLIRGFKWEGTDAEVGGTEVRLRRFQVKFPPGTAIRVDDIVVPASSIYDPSLAGRSLRVTDVARDGWQISRWVIAEEV